MHQQWSLSCPTRCQTSQARSLCFARRREPVHGTLGDPERGETQELSIPRDNAQESCPAKICGEGQDHIASGRTDTSDTSVVATRPDHPRLSLKNNRLIGSRLARFSMHCSQSSLMPSTVNMLKQTCFICPTNLAGYPEKCINTGQSRMVFTIPNIKFIS